MTLIRYGAEATFIYPSCGYYFNPILQKNDLFKTYQRNGFIVRVC